jgi:ferredoxin-type protein NapH
MKRLFTYNLISRVIFLLLTPTAFQALNIGFIWHSIYFGAITFVVLMWAAFILLSPLIGRVGCGWVCFMGTIQDFASTASVIKIKWNKPKMWIRIFNILIFFTTALVFLFIRFDKGLVEGIKFSPWFLDMDFNAHYKHIWIYDTFGAVIFGLLLERRWVCRNLCFMGALCAAGASYSRLIPVVDKSKCNNCGKCEADCLVRIPIKDYIANNRGLVTSAECLICGKCVESCNKKALKIKFVWNRRKYLQK